MKIIDRYKCYIIFVENLRKILHIQTICSVGYNYDNDLNVIAASIFSIESNEIHYSHNA